MAPRKVIEEGGKLIVRDPELDLQYELWGQAPVQAIGTFRGRDIYFRARHDEWTFEIADEAGDLPSDAPSSGGSFWSGEYSGASFMSPEVAIGIIARCLRERLK